MENNFSKCKLCGQDQIRWVKTKGGKNMPCEIAGVQGIDEEGEMRVVFIPHWGNCIRQREQKQHHGNQES